MKTKNFETGVIGFEVKTIKDVVSAMSLGFYICDENEYYFEDGITEVGEDGIEVERDPTEEEVLNRVTDALKDGCTMYATCNLPSGYMAVKAKSTILQSDFFVGQWVYSVQLNEVVKAQVKKVQIVSYAPRTSNSVATDTKYEIGYNNKYGHYNSVIVSEDNIFASVEKLTEHLTNNIVG